MIFVPGGPAIGTSGSNMTTFGEQLIGWNNHGEVIGSYTGGPYEYCSVIDANANGEMAVMVSVCPQTDGACVPRIRLVRTDGTVVEIDEFVGPYVKVYGINDAGVIVGVVRIDDSPWLQQVWIYDIAGGARLLETPEDCWAASVVGIANDGTVLGYTDTIGENGQRPLVWRNEIPEYLPTIEKFGRVQGIDGSNRIYGTCIVNNRTVPVRWSEGTIETFELPADAYFSEIHDVNAAGQAVGVYSNQSNTEIGVFVINTDSTVEVPGPLPENLAGIHDMRIDESGALIGTFLDGIVYTHDGFFREPGGPVVLMHTIAGGVLDPGINQAVAVDSGRFLVTNGVSAQESWIISRGNGPADLNQDGTIDAADLGLLLVFWGGCSDGQPSCPGDINVDGMVNSADLGQLLAAWSAEG